jgi:hypothetical protein
MTQLRHYGTVPTVFLLLFFILLNIISICLLRFMLSDVIVFGFVQKTKINISLMLKILRKRFKGVCNKDLMVVLNVYTIHIVFYQLLKHEVVH